MKYHGLLETRPDILPTEIRVGEFWTYLDHVTLLNDFIGVPRMHGDDIGKFGDIWEIIGGNMGILF